MTTTERTAALGGYEGEAGVRQTTLPQAEKGS